MSLISIQPLIDNFHYILIGLSFLLWSLARFVEAKAKKDPVKDGWDNAAEKLTWASAKYSQAIDWLCEAKVLNLTGQQKLEELQKKLKNFEWLVDNGKYIEAVSEVTGYFISAKNKIGPISLPTTGDQKEAPLKPR